MGTGQTPTLAPLSDVGMQTSKFCLLFLRVNDWKDAFLRGFNTNYMGRGCCVCLVWHRICLIPFSVSVALSESFLWSVNLNVIAWPNHYKSGFVRIFSYRAGAIQGYLLCSFTEEFTEVNIPLSSQKCSQRDWICLALFLAGKRQCHTVILAGCSYFLVFQRCPSRIERVPDLASGTCGTSASAQGHSIAAAPSVTYPFTWVSILLFSKWKNVSVLYLLARKRQVFSAGDMKVLEIYFESEAKNTYWTIFLMYFLEKLNCDCKSENTLFLARKIINFKMWEKNPKTPKTNPKPEYVHLGTF